MSPSLCPKCNGLDLKNLYQKPLGHFLFPYSTESNWNHPGGVLFTLDVPGADDWQPHYRYNKLQDSADDGCPLCKLILKDADAFVEHVDRKDKFTPEDLNSFRVYVTESDKYRGGIMLWTESDRDDVIFFLGEIGVVADENSGLKNNFPGRPIDSHPHKSRDWLKRQVNHCNDKHGHGLPLAGNTVLPHRVLDLSTLDIDGGQKNLRLLDNKSHQTGRYTTLSYHWPDGSTEEQHKALKATLIENLDQRTGPKGKINYDELTYTYQDAISITKDLGINYIWIDALCIVQDWPEDVDKQVAQMDKIYMDSYLTISCADGHRPFLTRDGETRREPPYYHSFTYKDKTSLVSDTLQAFRVPFKEALSAESTLNMGKDILSTRPWTFQERVLSRRSVFFASREVYFECENHFVGEDGFHSNKSRVQRPIHKSDKPRELFWSWVTEYSTRGPGKWEDKLLAFGGMAKFTQSAMPDAEYFAGLWSGKNLVGDFLWQRASDNKPKDAWPSQVIRAPTWSWAAIDGLIQGPAPEYRHCYKYATITEGPQIRQGAGGYGDVTNYRGLRLRSYFLRVRPLQFNGEALQLVTSSSGRLLTYNGGGALLDYDISLAKLQSIILGLFIIGRHHDQESDRVTYPCLLVTPEWNWPDQLESMQRIGTVFLEEGELADDGPRGRNPPSVLETLLL